MDKHLLISLFHIFAVVPLFLYVALSRSDTPQAVYTTLLVTGILVTLYHAYKGLLRLRSGSSALWINVIHAVFIGPLLIYIGYTGKDTPRSAYEILALFGFGALGYHIYHTILSMNLIMDGEKK
jgi:hypothetical protein